MPGYARNGEIRLGYRRSQDGLRIHLDFIQCFLMLNPENEIRAALRLRGGRYDHARIILEFLNPRTQIGGRIFKLETREDSGLVGEECGPELRDQFFFGISLRPELRWLSNSLAVQAGRMARGVGLMPNRHKTHATGHSTRLDREGITQPAKFGSERYSKEELIAELGAAFLSNEAGIFTNLQFENSSAYLGSWIQKFQNDPRMIVSAASQAQRSADFVLGIEHKEVLTEVQMDPACGLSICEPDLAVAIAAQPGQSTVRRISSQKICEDTPGIRQMRLGL